MNLFRKKPSPTPAAKPRPKVLFLWDWPEYPRLFALNFEKDFEVTPVTSREAALEALSSDSYSALLLNIISAIKGGGWNLIQELLLAKNPIPVIVVTMALRRDQGDVVFRPPKDANWPSNLYCMVSMTATAEIIKALHAVTGRASQPPAS